MFWCYNVPWLFYLTKLRTGLEPSIPNKEPQLAFQLRRAHEISLVSLGVIVSVAIGIAYLAVSFRWNGFLGFPLDDPWIFLVFARNIAEHHAFSYFRDEMVTSGATSPTYTFLMALLWSLWNNPYAISYAAGLFFMGILLIWCYKLAKVNLGGICAAIFLLLLAVQPRLNLISVSGMETTMFLSLLVVDFYLYRVGRWKTLGVFLGLTVWTRPDGFILWPVLMVDVILRRILRCEAGDPDATKSHIRGILMSFGIAVVFVMGYFIFNYALSGGILPNTYQAKIAFHGSEPRSRFLVSVLSLLALRDFIFVWLFFLVGLFFAVRDMAGRRYNPFLAYSMFVTLFIVVYFVKVPYTHRFERYLLPVIPFYMLVAMFGAVCLSRFVVERIRVSPKVVMIGWLPILLALVGLSAYWNWYDVKLYTYFCRLHQNLHVAAAQWIKEHTPPDAVIATHDVGAIGFYSDRRIIDLAGLVTPELASRIGRGDYTQWLPGYLEKHHVAYVVVLDSWFQVVNDLPVFAEGKVDPLKVHRFDPYVTHFQSREVSRINRQATELGAAGNVREALRLLEESRTEDPKSSQPLFLMGVMHESLGETGLAKYYLERALELFPQYPEANYVLAKIKYDEYDARNAKPHLDACLAAKPDFVPAYELLITIAESRGDSKASETYREKLRAIQARQIEEDKRAGRDLGL